MSVPITLVTKTVSSAGISENLKKKLLASHHGYMSDERISVKTTVVITEVVVEAEVASCETVSA